MATDDELARLASFRDALRRIVFSPPGSVAALVTAPEHGVHLCNTQIRVRPGIGVVGDRPYKQYWRGKPQTGRQISVMSAEVLDALRIDYETPGDNIIITGFDLSEISKGSALRVGDAVLIVTGVKHNPCKLFLERTSPAQYAAVAQGRLRGVMFDCLHPATIQIGDPVERIILEHATPLHDRR
jgi:MOSC domain-containing protein YiiM